MWEAMRRQIAAEEAHKVGLSTSLQVVSGVLGVVAAASLGYCVYRLVLHAKASFRNDWYISIDDIVFYHTSREGDSGREAFVLWPSVRSLTDVEDIEYGYEMLRQILQWPGKLNHRTIGLRLLEIKTMDKVRFSTKALLLWMKDSVSHNNVLQVIATSCRIYENTGIGMPRLCAHEEACFRCPTYSWKTTNEFLSKQFTNERLPSFFRNWYKNN